MNKNLITTKQAAKRLGCSLQRVRHLGEAGRIERTPTGNGTARKFFLYNSASVTALKYQMKELKQKLNGKDPSPVQPVRVKVYPVKKVEPSEDAAYTGSLDTSDLQDVVPVQPAKIVTPQTALLLKRIVRVDQKVDALGTSLSAKLDQLLGLLS